MDETNTYRKIADGGKILALGALLTGIYMYIRAQSFASEVSRFPQFVAIILIVCSLLVLAENFLPEPIQILIRDRSKHQDQLKKRENQTTEQKPTDRTTVELLSFEVDKSAFTFGSCIYYVAISYVIGIFYATPIFAMTYMYVTDKRWTTIISFGVLGYIISYLFTNILDVQLINGVLVT